MLAFLFFLLSCAANSSEQKVLRESVPDFPGVGMKKINGAAIVAASHPLNDSDFMRLSDVSVNFICLLPFAYVRENEPVIHYNSNFQWWGERPEGIAECIKMAHQCNLKVMVKPQLWISHGEYTGQMKFNSEADWKNFEASYTGYIFQLLKVADSMHAEIFCLGTELDYFVRERKGYWSLMIDSARKVYHGQITYAGNWDCYKDFPFWNRLDLIGINAYFPLSDSITPQVSELLQKWQPHFEGMKSFSQKTGKPVFFTEYGYRSIDYATQKPWESYTDGNLNFVAQQNAYEALYEKFWGEPWFSGGFFWKWFDEHTPSDVAMEKEFTPQNNPAMDVVKKWYRQN